MGGQQAVSRHRASGRLPARERVALLFDEGSRYQTGALAQPERRTEKKVPGDGVVTGFGRMDGRVYRTTSGTAGRSGRGTACSWYCSRPTAKGHVRRPGGRTSRPGP
jgi:acetyl-CoA carboxylase carboxyltransferase component